jgi:3-hydroxyisobutyrate dehydrogenase
MSAKPSIGFIGIGSMGWPMASLIHKAGFPVQVIDASAERAQAFVKEFGGSIAVSYKELAAAADIIITILPTDCRKHTDWPNRSFSWSQKR